MKIAIFHDAFSAVGGSEKLVIGLAQSLGADIITSHASEQVVDLLREKDITLIPLGSSINDPLLRTRTALKRFSECDFREKYDFFIFSGIHSIYAANKHRPALWYCHHIDKGLYYSAPKFFFQRLRRMIPVHVPLSRTFFNCLHVFRNSGFAGLRELARDLRVLWFVKTAEGDSAIVAHIAKIVVNSEHTKRAVRSVFNRDSSVIYPGIDVSKYSFQESAEFWLSVNRIEPHKRVAMQIDAFKELPNERLIIVGQKGDDPKCNAILNHLPDNVTYKGVVSQEELAILYARCKGFITTAKDEDFGMTAIEALASGK